MRLESFGGFFFLATAATTNFYYRYMTSTITTATRTGRQPYINAQETDDVSWAESSIFFFFAYFFLPINNTQVDNDNITTPSRSQTRHGVVSF